MRVVTVSTNVLSVNYTDEQGQVSARFFEIFLEMVDKKHNLSPNGENLNPECVLLFPTPKSCWAMT
jgi:hypothetical protein